MAGMYGGDLNDEGGPLTKRERRWTPCSACPQRLCCLPAKLEGEVLQAFERDVIHLPTLACGQTLVTEADSFEAFYVLKQGVLKSVRYGRDGDEQVVGFYFPGAMLGLEAYVADVWTADYVALRDAWLCRIPPDAVVSYVRCRLTQLACTALRDECVYRLALAHRNVCQRLASVLTRFSGAMGSLRFSLPMSRSDLASYLGTRAETLSRCIRKLTTDGLIAAGGRVIEVRDLEGLRQYAASDRHDGETPSIQRLTLYE